MCDYPRRGQQSARNRTTDSSGAASLECFAFTSGGDLLGCHLRWKTKTYFGNLAHMPQVTVVPRSGAEGIIPESDAIYAPPGATAPLEISGSTPCTRRGGTFWRARVRPTLANAFPNAAASR